LRFVLTARDLSPQSDDGCEVDALVLHLMMSTAQRLAVLIDEIRTAAPAADYLIDIQGTAARSELTHDASAITGDDPLSEVRTFALFGASLYGPLPKWGPSLRRLSPS